MNRVRWHYFVAAVGTWVMAAPSLLELTVELFRADVLAGGVLVVVAGYSSRGAVENEPMHGGALGVNLSAGVLLLAFPLYRDISGLIFWSDIACGSLVVMLTTYHLYHAFVTEQQQ
ncbi:hypothetical protein [Haloarcula salinisoli]|uniref:SPW repeat-containing protein n=1 Tax=Haloarcula salinisoli TaxID=2487746 RepID=A0A8J8CEC6_9EURY|nr:hypothetical protein [Halomicroarcula salinisoli]MBX0305590.1 hypothetical protein [Halomicroarcula salinisoli]